MKKKSALILLVFTLILILTFGLVACGDDQGTPNAPNENEGTPPVDGEDTNTDDKLLTFEGIIFEDLSIDYDGKEHSIEVKGQPTDATVNYTNNKGTNPGVYNATAKITKQGYKDLTLTAILTINKLTMANTIILNDGAFTYDGKKHVIEVEKDNLPDNYSIVYSGGEDSLNGATSVGTYTIKAVISAPYYNDKELTATLKINNLTMSEDIIFRNEKFEYDTQLHKITIEGPVPQGATITYSGGQDGKNGATDVGKYKITATISADNYVTKTLTAILTIDTKEEELNVALYNGKLYFQNPLHKNYLYSYDNTELTQVSRDCPISYVEANGKLYFLSKGLLTTTICSFDGINTESLVEVTGDNLATDGTYIYYVNNSIVSKEDNGIYKILIADIENQNIDPVATRITKSKADNLVYCNDYIYFANKDDGKKLYRISTNVVNGVSSKVYDYKVSEMIVNNGYLYFTRHHNLTAAIYKININGNPSIPILDDSKLVTKITASKGKNLTIIGNYVYFINTDMATSTIYGDGVYKTKADGSGWVGDAFQTLIGATKVVDGKENNVYALTGDGTNLYYYRHNDKHLYSYAIADEIETDVMADFVPPVEKNVITTYYEKTLVNNNEVYYINMTDGGRLYKYNIDNGSEFRLTGLQVADFTIHGDYLYFASVRFMVNYDLYKLNLINGEIDRISTDKCFHLVFDKDWIYYVNFSGSNTLNKMKYDGTGDSILYNEKSVADIPIQLINEKIYFNTSKGSDALQVYDIKTGTITQVTGKNMSAGNYLIHNNKLIIINYDGKNSIDIFDLTTNELLNTISLGTVDDARSLMIIGNDLFFYRNVAAGSLSKGLYKVDLMQNNSKAMLVDNMVREKEVYYLANAQLVDNKLYFIDAWQVIDSVPEPNHSSGKLCVYDLNTKDITVLN